MQPPPDSAPCPHRLAAASPRSPATRYVLLISILGLAVLIIILFTATASTGVSARAAWRWPLNETHRGGIYIFPDPPPALIARAPRACARAQGAYTPEGYRNNAGITVVTILMALATVYSLLSLVLFHTWVPIYAKPLSYRADVLRQ